MWLRRWVHWQLSLDCKTKNWDFWRIADYCYRWEIILAERQAIHMIHIPTAATSDLAWGFTAGVDEVWSVCSPLSRCLKVFPCCPSQWCLVLYETWRMFIGMTIVKTWRSCNVHFSYRCCFFAFVFLPDSQNPGPKCSTSNDDPLENSKELRENGLKSSLFQALICHK